VIRPRALALADRLAPLLLAAAVTVTGSSGGHARADDGNDERAEVSASAGAGVAALELVRPTSEGRQRLPSSAFAALDLGLGLHVAREQPVSFEVEVSYRSSLGFGLEVEPLFGLSQRVSARVQRAELTFAPRVRLASSRHAFALAFPVGMMLRSFVPELHQFGLPNYLLAGPQLRVELLAPLGDQVLLRLGPEVQWLALVDHSLREQGACCQGVALGAQASLEAHLGSTLSVALQARESHAFVGQGVRAFNEVERFVTAVVGGRL
jgi:hypothetical protein